MAFWNNSITVNIISMIITAYTQAVLFANNRGFTDVIPESVFHARRATCWDCLEETQGVCPIRQCQCKYKIVLESTTCPEHKWANLITGNLTVGV